MQSSETQVNQSAAEVNSTASKTPEKKAQLAAYMREYRKRRKLATEAAKIVDRDISRPADEFGETLHTFSLPEPQSSPTSPPDAAPVVHLGPHGYPAD